MRPDEQAAPMPAGSGGGDQGTVESYAPLLIDAKAAAALLSVSPQSLWRHTKRGAIPCVRVGRSVRYRPTELAAWLDAGAPTTPGAAARVRRGMREGGTR